MAKPNSIKRQGLIVFSPNDLLRQPPKKAGVGIVTLKVMVEHVEKAQAFSRQNPPLAIALSVTPLGLFDCSRQVTVP